MENGTCSTCRYHRNMPIWITAVSVDIRDYCCKDGFVSVEPDDTCNHWKTHFDESVTGTSFNKD